MITFTKLGEHGRLGNQLFQYALVKSISLETGYELQLPNLNNRSHHGQKCLLLDLNIKYTPITTLPKQIYYEKTEDIFDKDVFNVPPDTDFHGYFQHPSYFSKFRDIFIEEFKVKGSITNQAKDILSQFKNPTSVHIRLGDYLAHNQNPDEYPKLVIEYIKQCINRLDLGTDYLVFTGGSRNGNHDRNSDFDWCKEKLQGNNFHFMEGNSEILDFELIKNCKNNITGWDSTFSWWASYLNQNDGKIFCNTRHQVLPLYSYMKDWIVI